MQRTLTCFASGSAVEGWEAICIDFDIAVQGESFEDVFRLMTEAIQVYVDSALAEEPSVRDRLLHRSAPWWLKTRLAIGFLWRALRHKSDGGSAAGFSMPCPA
jgi:predicted RNase H-like HicB family nuclease